MSGDKRVREFVICGTKENISKHIAQTCAQFERLAREIWDKTYLEEAARIFPNMLRCIARQLKILRGGIDLPIEVAASACRNVFELNLRTRLMITYPERIKEFWVERVFEEMSIIKAFMHLSEEVTPSQKLAPLNARIAELHQYISKYKLTKSKPPSISEMAEIVGVTEEYKALYGFYSKYTHGTAWLVNAKDEERDGQGYRSIFLVQTQIYAFDAFKRIEDFVLANVH